MIIRYYKHIKNENILDGIFQLLMQCAGEFVPPLWQRSSSTQQNLHGSSSESKVPSEYFESIRRQSAFVAVDDGHVVGFMSFRRNYICKEIPRSFQPNIYITTVIVDPLYRNQGITGRFYEKLTDKFSGYHIFTRTWSTNMSHSRILSARRFFEHKRIFDDRGPGIDTVYYHRTPATRTVIQIIRQYRLAGNFVFLSMLTALTVFFLVIWFNTDSGVLHELSIAFSTSLIASALCLLSDSILKYRESKNDDYINTLKSFGIDNLQFHKDELLESVIPSCSKEIWISGYRLIITAKTSFRKAMKEFCSNASSKHPTVRLLTVAPWSDTFALVYGTEDVTDNYFKVISDLCRYRKDYGTNIEIRMTNKPIFNDTYKVDDRFVTGPYLHCTDSYNKKITARDFFSLDINDPKKELYDIILKDYTAVWESADYILDFDNTDITAFTDGRYSELTKEQKLSLLQSVCTSADKTVAD